VRAVFAALAANLGIAVAKFAAFLLTGSSSLLAEAVHSVADTFNEVLLLIGHGRSSRARTEEHPFGFGGERYFYGFIVAVLLFSVGAGFSAYQGIHKILHPEPVRSAGIAFAVLGVSAVLESFSLRTGVREANGVRGDRGWLTFIRRAKAPELVVVLLEDLAALTGLFLAFAGVLLAVLTGNGAWDGAGSVGISVLLALAATVVAVETKSLLIGESAGAEVLEALVQAVEDGPGGFRVIHLRTTHVGPESLLVAAKIAVPPGTSAEVIAAGIDAAERRMRAAVPIAETIYLEPDIYRPYRADQTDPSIRSVARSRRPRRDHTARDGQGPGLPGPAAYVLRSPPSAL